MRIFSLSMEHLWRRSYIRPINQPSQSKILSLPMQSSYQALFVRWYFNIGLTNRMNQAGMLRNQIKWQVGPVGAHSYLKKPAVKNADETKRKRNVARCSQLKAYCKNVIRRENPRACWSEINVKIFRWLRGVHTPYDEINLSFVKRHWRLAAASLTIHIYKNAFRLFV